MRAKGGNGSTFLQLFLFSFTFFTLYITHVGTVVVIWTWSLGPWFCLFSSLYFKNGSKF